jgi:amidase
MLEAIAGHDPKDATSLPGGAPSITAELEKGAKGVRLGWDEKFAAEGVTPDLAMAVNSAVKQLADLGATIKNVQVPDLSRFGKAWNTICSAEAVVAHAQYYPNRRAEYGTFFCEWLDYGSRVSTADYIRALRERNECVGMLNKLFQENEIDVLVAPTQEGPPPPVTEQSQFVHGPIDELLFAGQWARFTAVHDFSGAPTLSLPCGFNNAGLPLSLQLIGTHGREDIICRMGHAFEKATGYHKQHPQAGEGRLRIGSSDDATIH